MLDFPKVGDKVMSIYEHYEEKAEWKCDFRDLEITKMTPIERTFNENYQIIEVEADYQFIHLLVHNRKVVRLISVYEAYGVNLYHNNYAIIVGHEQVVSIDLETGSVAKAWTR